MKKTLITLLFVFSIIDVCSQPSLQRASKSVFTLTTFKADGTLLASSHGVFVGSNGEAIALWKPFLGADKAVVVDADGNKHDVEGIFGANEIYDVCKLKVAATVANTAPLASKAATAGSKTLIAAYSTKKPKVKENSITSVETFAEKFSYYMLSPMDLGNLEGCPLLNAAGEVLGLVQKSSSSSDIFSTDIHFIDSVETTGFSLKDPILSQTNVRLVMPDDKEQASLMLIMAADTPDTLKYEAYVNDFIAKFPTFSDGYEAKARLYAGLNRYEDADNVIASALSAVTEKDVLHSNYSTLIYNKVLFSPQPEYAPWTLEKSLEEVRTAYGINPLPAYTHQQGQILYSMKKYGEAYDIFMRLSQSPLRGGEVFYEAAQCKSQLNAPKEEVLALLDSAVNACRKPIDMTSAQYVLARGMALNEAGMYRKALLDYNEYDTIMNGRASADFYYTKFKCELQVRQYQQALNDIAHAALLNPTEPTYLAEMASLQLRLGDYEKAIQAADLCIRASSEYSDAHLIRGIALTKTGKKTEGLEALEKAKALGDVRAQNYIDKLK